MLFFYNFEVWISSTCFLLGGNYCAFYLHVELNKLGTYVGGIFTKSVCWYARKWRNVLDSPSWEYVCMFCACYKEYPRTFHTWSVFIHLQGAKKEQRNKGFCLNLIRVPTSLWWVLNPEGRLNGRAYFDHSRYKLFQSM